ncbi:MAG: hypothetical protein DRO98_07650 [Archaeoglobales archaeon]|nr:MAG: hypothetical protein DRO98_07650 [Archaeoglobales archaeon]
MKKKVAISITVIAILAISLYILSLPLLPEPEITTNPLNTELYLALASVGIEDAVVDITDERALIRYNLPENMSKESVNYYIMGAAATIAPNSSKIVIQVYENFTPVEEVVVSTEDVLTFMNETITHEEFEKRIEVRSLK